MLSSDATIRQGGNIIPWLKRSFLAKNCDIAKDGEVFRILVRTEDVMPPGSRRTDELVEVATVSFAGGITLSFPEKITITIKPNGITANGNIDFAITHDEVSATIPVRLSGRIPLLADTLFKLPESVAITFKNTTGPFAYIEIASFHNDES
jgi:hypothetical protein